MWQERKKEKLTRKVRMPKAAQVPHKGSQPDENPCISVHDDFTEK